MRRLTHRAAVRLGRMGGGEPGAWRPLAPFARPFVPTLTVLAVLVLAGTSLRLLRPWPLKFLFDDVLIQRREGVAVHLLLAAIAGALVAIALLDALLGFVRQYLLKRAGQKVAFQVRVALHEKIHQLSLTFHDRQRTGDLLTSVTKDVDRVQELVTDHALEALSNTLVLVGMLGVMLWLDWQLSLAMLLLNPILAFMTWRYRTTVKRAEEAVRATDGQITSLAQETISSMRVVKAYGREGYEVGRFRETAEEALDANVRVARTEAAYGSRLDVLTAVAMAALVWLGAVRVLSGAITAGELLVFTNYIRDFYGPTRGLTKVGAKVARASVRAARVAGILRQEPGSRDLPGARPAPPLAGRIRFDHVTFAYLPGHPVLEDVSFEVPARRVVAIVGPTGSGKSTLGALLGRLYEPTHGRVLIDDKDVRSYTLESLQSQVSYVLQEAVLFHTSIRENIAYGRVGATEDEIVSAAKLADAHDFVTALPHGYDTMVGERGATLSGGQRQRIAIARALVRDAPILVLDEPTTGLDAKAEREVLDALDRLMVDRTTIVIAHRLSTVRHADAIVVLDQGRVVEHGTHDELLARGGMYAAFWWLQSHSSRSRPDVGPLVEGTGPVADGRGWVEVPTGPRRRRKA